jgi:hypothetical protein
VIVAQFRNFLSTLCEVPTGIVVKIVSWLLKSYDFTSQHVYNVSNWVRTRNRLNSVKSDRFYEFDRFWPSLTNFKF